MKSILAIMFAATAILGMTMALTACSSSPKRTGLIDGGLGPCPDTPNCVSSESKDESSRCEPLRFRGSPVEAWEDLKYVITEMGAEIKEDKAGYLWAVYTSRIFRFKDDVEFRLAEAEGLIHIRSASRIGRSDLGANRKRVNLIKEKFEQRQ